MRSANRSLNAHSAFTSVRECASAIGYDTLDDGFLGMPFEMSIVASCLPRFACGYVRSALSLVSPDAWRIEIVDSGPGSPGTSLNWRRLSGAPSNASGSGYRDLRSVQFLEAGSGSMAFEAPLDPDDAGRESAEIQLESARIVRTIAQLRAETFHQEFASPDVAVAKLIECAAHMRTRVGDLAIELLRFGAHDPRGVLVARCADASVCTVRVDVSQPRLRLLQRQLAEAGFVLPD